MFEIAFFSKQIFSGVGNKGFDRGQKIPLKTMWSTRNWTRKNHALHIFSKNSEKM
jgi:hypothetical protein